MHIKRYFFVSLFVILSAGMFAQYTQPSLVIYHSNGLTDIFPCEQIDSITYSYYDTENRLCDEVVTLQLHESDTLVRTLIHEIDSMKVLSLSSYCPDSYHPHAIDLGLPGGAKWACCNVGATVPEGFGGYYAWGEVEEKDVYMDYHYIYGRYDESENEFYCQDIGSNISKTEYDVAYVKWGEPWCMPTRYDYLDLIYNTECQYTNFNGVDGWIFTGSNGNSVFMPSAGYKSGVFHNSGVQNWTSSAYVLNDYHKYAYFITIILLGDNSLCNTIYNDKYVGRTVRAVTK